MKDLMLDLETLNTSQNSVITQIGACYFDRFSGKIKDTFFLNVDIQSGLDNGFEVSGDTIYWWLNQSDEARKSLIHDGYKSDIKTALTEINNFMENTDTIWCHPSFDIVILLYGLKKFKIKPKFSFRSYRDMRTINDIIQTFNIKIKEAK